MPKKAQRTAQKKTGPAKSNQHITKISASSKHEDTTPSPAPATAPSATHVKKVSIKSKAAKKADLKTTRITKKAQKRAERKSLSSDERPLKSYFALFRPFIALGRYIRDSWRELRQVRWPSRKATWKLTGAVLVYCIILMAFVLALDLLFTFLFNLIIK